MLQLHFLLLLNLYNIIEVNLRSLSACTLFASLSLTHNV